MVLAAGLRRRSSSFLPHLALLLALLLLLSFHPGNTLDSPSEKAALLELSSKVGQNSWKVMRTWNSSNSYCGWAGVHCIPPGYVSELHLPGFGLKGQFPTGVLGNLTNLQVLSLRLNSLYGPIPADIGACVGLRIINLESNSFSGDIPTELLTLKNLTGLNLAGNVLSGPIPPGLSGLEGLHKLNLEHNRLVGQIPNLELPQLVQFNVSENRLTGQIPPKLQHWPDSSFLGMPNLCGGHLRPCATPPNGHIPSETQHSKLSAAKITGIVIACIIAFLLIVALVFLLVRRRHAAEKNSMAVAAGQSRVLPAPATSNVAAASSATRAAAREADGGGGGLRKKLVFVRWDERKGRVFDLEELLRASAEILGKGTFGTTYRAWLDSGVGVAVKRLKDVDMSEAEFQETVAVYGAMDHPNLIPLRAYYYSKDEKLLVYSYEPEGSLSALLHGSTGSGRSPLNWEARLAIASDAARGLEYIHSRGPSISHGNIKSSNILLANSACISDQGLVWMAKPSATAARTGGCRAPEVTDPRRASHKADVYSFGVLLLELLTGKPPGQVPLNEGALDLPRWVRGIEPEEWPIEVFDLELLRYGDVEEEMFQLMHLALECAALSPDERPTMSQVVRRIEGIRPPMDPAEVNGQSHSPQLVTANVVSR